MNALTGTGRLIRLALRRDRFVLPAWIIVLAALLTTWTMGFANSLKTQADVVRETQIMASNAGFRMLSLSPGASIGAHTMNRGYVTLAVLAAVMSALAVVRHTRQNEETGRAEVLRAGVIGPAAPVAAGVIVTVCANVVLAALLGIGMVAAGQPVASSFAAGAAIAGVGVAFTGVAALTSQLSSTARGANGLAVAALAVSFVVAGVGNMLGHADRSGTVAYSAWPTWLSPIGWGYEMRPFGGDRWWLLGLSCMFAAVLIGAAVRYAARRDLGRGLLPVQTGRAGASRGLLRPVGLAWRLQRPSFLSWLAGLIVWGLVFGSVSDSVRTAEGNMRDWYQRMAGTDVMLDAWFTLMVELAGIMAAVYGVQVLLRMRGEESQGRLEAVLGCAVSRPRWVMSYVVTAALGAVALLLAFAVAMGLAAGQALGDTYGLLAEFTAAALAEVPAVLVIVSAVVVLFALLPRWAVWLSWALLVVSVLLSPMFGPDFGLPQWVLDLSPFTHQKAPAVAVSGMAIAALVAIAAVLIAAGLAAFRRRDLVPG
jgi:ABC-2 type transport system permease protein